MSNNVAMITRNVRVHRYTLQAQKMTFLKPVEYHGKFNGLTFVWF